MEVIFSRGLLLCLALVVFSFFKRNDLPEKIGLAPSAAQEPIQTAIDKPAITAPYKNIEYTIQPKFDYEISGLVVSFKHHDGDHMLHKLWNDHLNSADLCIVWGDTAQQSTLNQIKFWNGQFTCNFKTRSNQAWKNFSVNQISNNHLISADDNIRDSIKHVKIGDQVTVKGWLSSYKGDQGERGTSTTRTDTGNGACETILVKSFEIIKPGDILWRKIFYLSLIGFSLMLAGYLISPRKLN